LSQNKSLRALEIPAASITVADQPASDFLRTVLSSITSPVPLDVVIIYPFYLLGGGGNCGRCNSDPICFCHPSKEKTEKYVREYQQQLRVFHEMHSVRDFRLVLFADVSNYWVEHTIKRLERFVKAEKVKGGLGPLPYKPLIISERQMLRTRHSDHVGWPK